MVLELVLVRYTSNSTVVAVCEKFCKDTATIFPGQAWEYPITDTIIKKIVNKPNLRFFMIIVFIFNLLFNINLKDD